MVELHQFHSLKTYCAVGKRLRFALQSVDLSFSTCEGIFEVSSCAINRGLFQMDVAISQDCLFTGVFRLLLYCFRLIPYWLRMVAISSFFATSSGTSFFSNLYNCVVGEEKNFIKE